MGIETILLGVSAISKVGQISSQRRASRARAEGNAVRGANEAFQNRRERRRIAKEARVRRARIANAAALTGTTGSSGELGAFSAIGSSFGASTSAQQSNILTAQGANRAATREASAIGSGARAEALGGLFKEAVGAFESYKEYERYS